MPGPLISACYIKLVDCALYVLSNGACAAFSEIDAGARGLIRYAAEAVPFNIAQRCGAADQRAYGQCDCAYRERRVLIEVLRAVGYG